MNFAVFYANAIKDANRKRKKGKYKGHRIKSKHKNLPLPGPAYIPSANKLQAPSASTYTIRG